MSIPDACSNHLTGDEKSPSSSSSDDAVPLYERERSVSQSSTLSFTNPDPPLSSQPRQVQNTLPSQRCQNGVSIILPTTPPALVIHVLDRQPYRYSSCHIAQASMLPNTSSEGKVEKEEIPGEGALFPEGYLPRLKESYPWVCPVRDCRLLFEDVSKLGGHFSVSASIFLFL